jgi:glucose/arabinose dehydrogenase
MRTSPRLIPSILAVSIAAILASLVLTAVPSSGPSMTRLGGPLGSTAGPVAAGPADAIPVSAQLPAVATPPTGEAFDPTKVALSLSLVKSGFASPLLVTNAHDGSGRLFVVEQAGRIQVIKPGTTALTTMLDLRGSISSGGERGLLGLAFDPKFPTYPYIYVNFTDTHGDTAISRYTIGSNPDVAVRSTGVRILTIDQPYANHNGGNIEFGPDGYLYIGMGDGGSGGDPQNRAQNVNSLLGKMLRIDVHHGTRTRHYTVPDNNPYVGRTGNDLIWSRGLRNPWRWSFDSATKALWIGDVGQDRYEEVDRSLVSGSTPAGRAANYGWSVMEGRACFKPSSGCSTSGKQLPLAAYGHAASGTANCAVTGGFVYRGSASPVLVGGYLFGDFCSGRIWAVSATAASPATPRLLKDSGTGPQITISSFGRDEAGELYLTDLGGGAVYRISATAKP